ncbi:transposase [Thioalkalivibrio sp. ALMg11]|uniref:transposase n=1 Tax=Thioalkalivibrio sp. ALMg11 TaxID=1158165 RepID=UPI00037224FE|nr:transposase [Thioalkalivibrio sp. ALMg11]
MTRARKELVSIEATPYYHCICRCVRRAFLCGEDFYSGKNYEHRRGWLLERLRALQDVFAVDVCAYAVMSNHYHLVLRLDSDRAASWSEDEVMERWERLFSLPLLVARYRAGQTRTEAEREGAQAQIALWRERLQDLSWFMRSLNEHLARRANAEDGCKGRFWEGRYKSQALLDDAAVLTCMSYVDLNPVRAGMADTPAGSDFTSIQQRIREGASVPGATGEESGERTEPRLTTLGHEGDDGHPNAVVFTTDDYLELVDWTGRAIREDKRGAIPDHIPPILDRLQIDPAHFLRHVRRGGRSYHVAALGRVERMRKAAMDRGRHFIKGIGVSRRIFVGSPECP